MRRFVIGDIHGCGKALRTVLEQLTPDSGDELIFLGDYVDRGPDSRDVVDQLVALKRHCRVVPLRGNHEIMLMGVAFGGLDATGWLGNGGRATLASYGGSLSKIPDSHLEFFTALRPYHETDRHLFVHAGYTPEIPMAKQEDAAMYWEHMRFPPPPPHCSGKRAFVGHTPQPDGNVVDHGHLVCLDTYCFGGGYLTAMEIDRGELVQVDRQGHLRRNRPLAITAWLTRLRERWLARRDTPAGCGTPSVAEGASVAEGPSLAEGPSVRDETVG